jgi:hypothetical protein
VYEVGVVGFTVTDVPVTGPIPGFNIKAGDPVTTQLSVLDCPGVIFAALAVKLVIAGG